jgi:hypothetical protein
MDQHKFGELITAFFACAYRPALLGLPLEFLFHFPFYKVFIISVSAAAFGSFVSAFLSEELILLYNYLKRKFFPRHKKRVFTKFNRIYIRMKKHIGIAGIAALAPAVLSIPFGTFLCIRFFGYDKLKKTVLYITISTSIWTVLLYFLYHTFDVKF